MSIKNWYFIVPGQKTFKVVKTFIDVANFCCWALIPQSEELYTVYAYVQFKTPKKISTLQNFYLPCAKWEPTTIAHHRLFGPDFTKYPNYCYYGVENTTLPGHTWQSDVQRQSILKRKYSIIDGVILYDSKKNKIK